MSRAPNSKTVTGFPVPQNHRVIGYPAAIAVAPPPSSPFFTFYQQPAATATATTHFHRPTTTFLCRMLAVATAVLLIMLLVTIIIYLALKPSLLSFEIDSATITSLNTTDNKLTATFDITLVFQNPNHKLSVSYKDLDASVHYGNDDRALASTRLPPFSQGTESKIRVRARFVVVDEFVDSGVAKRIAAERARDGSVDFGVSLFAWVRFRSGILHSVVRSLRVECDPVTIAFPSLNNGTGTLVVPSICSAG